MPGEADQAVGMRQRLDAGVDGRALGRIIEEPGVLEGIVAVLALERVHHPGDVAHAADQLGVREEPHQRGKLGGPGAVGVEDHRLLEVGIVAVEEPAQEARALRLVDHGRELGAGRDLGDDAVEQPRDRARHAGMEARILPQDGGRERRARARQAGDEVPPPLHQMRRRRPRPNRSSPLQWKERSHGRAIVRMVGGNAGAPTPPLADTGPTAAGMPALTGRQYPIACGGTRVDR